LHLYRQPPDVRGRLLEEITATLGRRSRAQLWEEVLLILAGLWNDTGALLRLILSGVALTEGDQIYIAARCLNEARQAFPNGSSQDPIVRSIVNALIYRSHPRSLRPVGSRKKAIEFLGPLREPLGIPHLVSLALDKIRLKPDGTADYDYSGVRLAAIKNLLHSPEAVIQHVQQNPEWKHDVELHSTLDAWLKFDAERLLRSIQSENKVVASVAAFALALTKLPGAHAAIANRFAQPGTSEDLLWAVTDALDELGDPAISDLISRNLTREDRREQIAYLIGKLGEAKPGTAEWRFLHDGLNAGSTRFRGRCLQSLAELRDTSILPACHACLNKGETAYRYALQALRHVGNEHTLAILTQTQWRPEHADAGASSLSLERLRLEVYEDIYWRLAGGRSREVMVAIPKSMAEKAATGET
jgi:hypothetical protein